MKLTKRNKDALTWLINRLHKKTKLPKSKIENALGAIADLEWEWRHSKYDLYGLQLQDILVEWGEKRAPAEKRGDTP